jgi:hypothetical protein
MYFTYQARWQQSWGWQQLLRVALTRLCRKQPVCRAASHHRVVCKYLRVLLVCQCSLCSMLAAAASLQVILRMGKWLQQAIYTHSKAF